LEIIIHSINILFKLRCNNVYGLLFYSQIFKFTQIGDFQKCEAQAPKFFPSRAGAVRRKRRSSFSPLQAPPGASAEVLSLPCECRQAQAPKFFLSHMPSGTSVRLLTRAPSGASSVLMREAHCASTVWSILVGTRDGCSGPLQDRHSFPPRAG